MTSSLGRVICAILAWIVEPDPILPRLPLGGAFDQAGCLDLYGPVPGYGASPPVTKTAFDNSLLIVSRCFLCVYTLAEYDALPFLPFQDLLDLEAGKLSAQNITWPPTGSFGSPAELRAAIQDCGRRCRPFMAKAAEQSTQMLHRAEKAASSLNRRPAPESGHTKGSSWQGTGSVVLDRFQHLEVHSHYND